MNSTKIKSVYAGDEAFGEIMEKVLSLYKTGKLHHKLQDVVIFLSECKENVVGPALPPEFIAIRHISSDLNALSDYLDSLMSSKKAQKLGTPQEFSTTKSSKPQLPAQDDVPEGKFKIKEGKVVKIAKTLVFSGSFADLGDEQKCMLSISRYLLLAKEPSYQNITGDFTKTCEKIITLHDSLKTVELKEEFRQIIVQANTLNFCGAPLPFQYNKEIYTEKVNKVVDIVTTSIKSGAYDNFDPDKMKCTMSAIAYLTIKEKNCEKSVEGDLNTLHVLPTEHAIILKLDEEDDILGLVRYLSKLLINARDTVAIERLEHLLQGAGLNNDSSSKLERNGQSLIAALGTTLTAGLSAMHVLVPADQAFKSIIDNLNIALLNPTLSHWLSICGVSSVFVVGICMWNAECVLRRTKSLKEAGKSIIDEAGSMLIGSVVGFAAASAFASMATPVFLSFLMFGGIGLCAQLISKQLISRVTKWYFYGLPEDQAIPNAYKTLGVKPNVSDHELRRAYRNQTRKYHPDKITQTEENIKKLHEVREAYEYLLTIRVKQMEQVNEPGFFERMKKYMASMWESEDINDDGQIQANKLQ